MNFNNLKYFNLCAIDSITARVNSNNISLDLTALEDLYIESYSNSTDLLTSFEEMMFNNSVQNDFNQFSNLSFFKKDISLYPNYSSYFYYPRYCVYIPGRLGI